MAIKSSGFKSYRKCSIIVDIKSVSRIVIMHFISWKMGLAKINLRPNYLSGEVSAQLLAQDEIQIGQ
jgi:hypothetical protein